MLSHTFSAPHYLKSEREMWGKKRALHRSHGAAKTSACEYFTSVSLSCNTAV